MSQVYSVRFFAAQSTTEELLTYTVPAGMRAVLRHIDWVGQVGGGTSGAAAIFLAGASAFVDYFSAPGPGEIVAGIYTGHWDGRAVFYEGEEIGCSLVPAGITLSVFASGYLLALP